MLQVLIKMLTYLKSCGPHLLTPLAASDLLAVLWSALFYVDPFREIHILFLPTELKVWLNIWYPTAAQCMKWMNYDVPRYEISPHTCFNIFRVKTFSSEINFTSQIRLMTVGARAATRGWYLTADTLFNSRRIQGKFRGGRSNTEAGCSQSRLSFVSLNVHHTEKLFKYKSHIHIASIVCRINNFSFCKMRCMAQDFVCTGEEAVLAYSSIYLQSENTMD